VVSTPSKRSKGKSGRSDAAPDSIAVIASGDPQAPLPSRMQTYKQDNQSAGDNIKPHFTTASPNASPFSQPIKVVRMAPPGSTTYSVG